MTRHFLEHHRQAATYGEVKIRTLNWLSIFKLNICYFAKVKINIGNHLVLGKKLTTYRG